MAKKIKVLDNVSGVEQIINVSSLASNGTITGTDLMLIEQSNTLKKVSITDLSAEFSGGGGDIIQTITMSADATYNKSGLTGNILFLSTNNTTTRTFTVGTGFVANDKLTFIINNNSLGLISININSQNIDNNRGSILNFIYNGTNWISTNVYGWDLSTTNLANTIYGFNNQARVDTQNTVIYGSSNINHGESVVLGINNSDTSQNSGVLTGKSNTSSGVFNSIYGTSNTINEGSYNVVLGYDNRNVNSINYIKAFGNGTSALHNGEIVFKIDNENYVNTGYTSHLRIVNFGGVSINNANEEIFLNDSSSAKLVIPQNTTYFIKGRIVAIKNDETEIKQWDVDLTIQTNNSNTTQILGTQNSTILQETTNATDYNFTLSADNTNKSLKVEVQGRTGETIQFKAVFEIIDIRL